MSETLASRSGRVLGTVGMTGVSRVQSTGALAASVKKSRATYNCPVSRLPLRSWARSPRSSINRSKRAWLACSSCARSLADGRLLRPQAGDDALRIGHDLDPPAQHQLRRVQVDPHARDLAGRQAEQRDRRANGQPAQGLGEIEHVASGDGLRLLHGRGPVVEEREGAVRGSGLARRWRRRGSRRRCRRSAATPATGCARPRRPRPARHRPRWHSRSGYRR